MCSPLYKVAILKEIVVGWVLRCPVTAVVKSWLVPTSCGDSDLCKRSVFIRYRCLFLLCASCSARHRGLDVFVTTPRYEHTCHLLSRYLQCHGVRYAPSHFFPAVTLDAGGKGGVCVCCTIHHRVKKSHWDRPQLHSVSWLWFIEANHSCVYVWVLSSTVGITGTTWHQLFILQPLQLADGGIGLRELRVLLERSQTLFRG